MIGKLGWLLSTLPSSDDTDTHLRSYSMNKQLALENFTIKVFHTQVNLKQSVHSPNHLERKRQAEAAKNALRSPMRQVTQYQQWSAFPPYASSQKQSSSKELNLSFN